MRAVRVASVTVVLALLGLLVWDVAHGSGAGIAGKVDKGQTVAAPALRLPTLRLRRSEPGLLPRQGRGRELLGLVVRRLQARGARARDRRAQWSGKNVVFLGVDGQDLGSAAKSYMRRYDVSYPVARDINGTAYKTWGVTGFPETFFVTPTAGWCRRTSTGR